MQKTRKHYSPQEKLAILKLHLVDKMPISDVCDQYQILPTMFYKWQKQLFENGAAAFERVSKRTVNANERQIAALEAKLQQKNEVVAELLQEHVQLKKEIGEL
jgi:transposase-like protein